MNLLFAPVLAVVLSQAGEDAEKTFRAMESKVAKADTLQVTFEGKLEGPKGEGGSFKGQVQVGTGNKARIEAELTFMGKSSKMTMISDGTKMASVMDGKSNTQDTPPAMRSLMTVALARLGIGTAVFMVSAPGDKTNPLETIKVSDFKKGKAEKVGDRMADVIEYKLNINGKMTDCAVWIDSATGLPLRRTLRGSEVGATFTFTETYGMFAINPKLDAKVFALPQ
jgi:outer membrane lipoprotein-sorting protein